MEYIKNLDSSDFGELLDDIRFKVFSGRWTGIAFFKGLNIEDHDYKGFTSREFSNVLINNYFVNPYAKTIPNHSNRKGASYTELIGRWSKLVIDDGFKKYHPQYRKKNILKIKKITTLEQGGGTFFCKDINVLQAFLLWYKFKEVFWTGKFNRNNQKHVNKLLSSCLVEAKNMLKKFGFFMIVSSGKDSVEHIIFDEIFLITNGNYHESFYENKKMLIISGVMK